MKIRTGFVSNSSSSSFCIRADAYKSVFELAQIMVMCREWNDDGRDDRLVQQIAEDAENMDPNSDIAFSTCNYWTYIRKVEDHYVVQTCNNHAFHEYLEGIDNNWPKVIRDEAMGAGFDNDLYDYCSMHIADNGTFWFPEFRVWGRELEYTNKRTGCKSHPWAIMIREAKTGNIVCSSCYWE